MIEKKDGGGERTGLKPAQVAASALAAVTAAFLGSTLGVTGTVVGAGLASVITSVGSELYLHSLRKTKEAARRTRKAAAFVADSRLRQQQTRRIEAPPTRPVNPLRRADDPTVRVRPGEQPTVRLPRPGQPLHATASGPAPPATRVAERMPAESKRPWWKSPWTVAAGMGVLAFVIGMLVITGIETVTGHTLSGGQGTTISQLGGGAGHVEPATGAHPTPEQTPSATVTPTKEPAVVSPQHRSTPSRGSEPSTESSPTPSTTTSETESSARPTSTTSSATPTSR